jgi:hypothetical protein
MIRAFSVRCMLALACMGVAWGAVAVAADCSDDSAELANSVRKKFKNMKSKWEGNYGAYCGAAGFNDTTGAKAVPAAVFGGAKDTLEKSGYTYSTSFSGELSYKKKKGTAQLIYHATAN